MAFSALDTQPMLGNTQPQGLGFAPSGGINMDQLRAGAALLQGGQQGMNPAMVAAMLGGNRTSKELAIKEAEDEERRRKIFEGYAPMSSGGYSPISSHQYSNSPTSAPAMHQVGSGQGESSQFDPSALLSSFGGGSGGGFGPSSVGGSLGGGGFGGIGAFGGGTFSGGAGASGSALGGSLFPAAPIGGGFGAQSLGGSAGGAGFGGTSALGGGSTASLGSLAGPLTAMLGYEVIGHKQGRRHDGFRGISDLFLNAGMSHDFDAFKEKYLKNDPTGLSNDLSGAWKLSTGDVKGGINDLGEGVTGDIFDIYLKTIWPF